MDLGHALGPAPGEGKVDPRWGKGRRLTADSKDRFYYWGWVGDGATIVEPTAGNR